MQRHGYERTSTIPTEASTQTLDRIALVVLASATSGLVAIAWAFLP